MTFTLVGVTPEAWIQRQADKLVADVEAGRTTHELVIDLALSTMQGRAIVQAAIMADNELLRRRAQH